MKRSILIFLVIGTVMIFFGCSGDNPMAPKLNQGDPMAKELNQSDQVANSLAKKPLPSLRCTTEYDFRGADDPPAFDTEGRLLAWEGPISGDITGVIKWWMFVPFELTGQVSHYEDRFEIWNDDETVLLLAGDEAGTTTARHGKNSNWRTNGIVTEAAPEYVEWLGRKAHAEGHFTWLEPGLPDNGYGTFKVN